MRPLMANPCMVPPCFSRSSLKRKVCLARRAFPDYDTEPVMVFSAS